MTTPIKSHFEKLLLVLAGGALLLSGGWCWRREAATPLPLRAVKPANEDYRSAVSSARSTVANWAPPAAQPAGVDWIFEVFSPPLIHRDENTGAFFAGMPPAIGRDGPEPGIRLLAIRAIPYRVQFQGSFGLPGDSMAVLVAVETQEVWCARPGERWAAAGVALEKGDVRIDALVPDDPSSGLGHLARVTLRDEKTGGQVVLVAGVPTLTRELAATVRLASSSKTQNLREGDICDDGEFTYRVDRLSLDPVVVAMITKTEARRQVGETLLLRPDKSDTGEPDGGVRAESSFSPHSFHNGP